MAPLVGLQFRVIGDSCLSSHWMCLLVSPPLCSHSQMLVTPLLQSQNWESLVTLQLHHHSCIAGDFLVTVIKGKWDGDIVEGPDLWPSM